MSCLEYLEWYNKQDVIIKCPIIDFLINKFHEYAIDMLKNISLSACADQVKFAMAYKDFSVDGDYSRETKTTFKLSEEYLKKKVDEYRQQDINAKRNVTNNITMEDYEYFRDLIENSTGYICKEGFRESNKPTLDRENNKIDHTKGNVIPCNYCNCVKGDRDRKYTQLHVQLRKFAIKNHLPPTFAKGDEEEYEVTRRNITGGLSNVHNKKILKVLTL
jgi:hypothetical protein